MSLPREVIAGRFYMVTRRCTQRQFLLHPDAETNNAFLGDSGPGLIYDGAPGASGPRADLRAHLGTLTRAPDDQPWSG
jgi:hypothetical protein